MIWKVVRTLYTDDDRFVETIAECKNEAIANQVCDFYNGLNHHNMSYEAEPTDKRSFENE